MRLFSAIAFSCLMAFPAAATVVEFDEFADGTAITDHYPDFTVDLIGTDIDATILIGNYVSGDPKSALRNTNIDSSIGHVMLITFNSAVENVVIGYTAINTEGGADVTTAGGTVFQAMESDGCRITLCSADFSALGSIFSMQFEFTDGFDIEAWHMESLAYDIVEPVPLPATGLLLLGALGAGVGLRRARKSKR